MRVLLISANRELIPSPVVPIGVLTIAGAIRDSHDVRVLDLCFVPDIYRAIEEAIADFDPELIGLGLRNLNTNAYDNGGNQGLIASYGQMAATIKRCTSAPLVVGGSGFSLQPQKLMALMQADHGIIGEGELAFRQVVDKLARGETPPRFLHGDAVIQSNVFPKKRLKRSSEISSDLDFIPPVARDFTDPRYYEWSGTESFQTKRGCAFGCTYCVYPDLEGRRVRVRTPSVVADEVLQRSRVPGVKFAFFVDSVFNVPPKAAVTLCDELVARGNPLPWSCYATPAAFTEEVAAAMQRAGCQGVEIGTDSGSPGVLKRLHKPFGLKEVFKTRELCVKYGILDSHTFVLGAEDETLDETRETIRMVADLDPDIAIFVAFVEDREEKGQARAKNRRAILDLLAEEAPARPGWCVPEIGLRFSIPPKGTVGPHWLHEARARRQGAGDHA
jgi:radical SAM superfamily enzyme YgiQ (UPF0313 family)